jgi:dethiobiotin synthetase
VTKVSADSHRIVLVGTGTGIGKTHLGVALVHALAGMHRQVVGLKPVESGIGLGVSDAELLAHVSSFPVKHPQPYALPDPISPHLAARRAGVDIEIERIVGWVEACSAPSTLIETAGGLLSPLNLDQTNLDLAVALKPEALVLVAVDRLGVLHDVRVCLVALSTLAPSCPDPVVVLQAPEHSDASTGTNREELRRLRLSERVFEFPRAEPTSAEAVQAALRVVDCFT